MFSHIYYYYYYYYQTKGSCLSISIIIIVIIIKIRAHVYCSDGPSLLHRCYEDYGPRDLPTATIFFFISKVLYFVILYSEYTRTLNFESLFQDCCWQRPRCSSRHIFWKVLFAEMLCSKCTRAVTLRISRNIPVIYREQGAMALYRHTHTQKTHIHTHTGSSYDLPPREDLSYDLEPGSSEDDEDPPARPKRSQGGCATVPNTRSWRLWVGGGGRGVPEAAARPCRIHFRERERERGRESLLNLGSVLHNGDSRASIVHAYEPLMICGIREGAIWKSL